MADTASSEAAVLARRAVAVAQILETLANARRLVVLCKLVEWGEATVGSLAEASGLSQSALSQHLAKMRQAELLTYRRDGQTLWYRIADPRIEQLIATLHDLFCAPATKMKKGKPR
ncbi:MAG: metalloregulator ArsR/SmtB family transcription factor [Xanthobacteraceae bacterium]|jgi:ArsR family transcriptional regulator